MSSETGRDVFAFAFLARYIVISIASRGRKNGRGERKERDVRARPNSELAIVDLAEERIAGFAVSLPISPFSRRYSCAHQYQYAVKMEGW